MFNFGWAELLVIIALSVFVIGPKEIPEIMMTLGRFVRRLQYIKYAFTQQFEDFMQQHDLNEIRHYAAMQDHRDGGDGEHHMMPLDKTAEDDAAKDTDKNAPIDMSANAPDDTQPDEKAEAKND